MYEHELYSVDMNCMHYYSVVRVFLGF